MWNFIGFNLIYWSPICGKYFLDCSFLEKCGKIWINGRFSGWLGPDWRNTARAATAGLGSKGLSRHIALKMRVPATCDVDIFKMPYLCF